MTQMATVVRVGDGRLIIEVDPSIVKTGNIKNGTLFEQHLTEDGILLKRADMEENQDDGPTPARTSPTARYGGGTET